MATLCRNFNQLSRLAPSTIKRGLASGTPGGPGLNFHLSDEQKELVDLAEKFTKEEIIPNAPHYDQVMINLQMVSNVITLNWDPK